MLPATVMTPKAASENGVARPAAQRVTAASTTTMPESERIIAIATPNATKTTPRPTSARVRASPVVFSGSSRARRKRRDPACPAICPLSPRDAERAGSAPGNARTASAPDHADGDAEGGGDEELDHADPSSDVSSEG